ncbi:MAG: DUF1294 domain-containing protein [Lachnospiraceae bacterium]|nr:DUF1294 domain-containing protein [Lachnospiraceae bacterium]
MTETILRIGTVYLLAINLITFICYAADKRKAVGHKWRIKESTLIGLCVIGGSVGGLLGMYLMHHKTKKPLFFIGVPLILIAQTAAVIAYLNLKGS